jgi:hypothetical protein
MNAKMIEVVGLRVYTEITKFTSVVGKLLLAMHTYVMICFFHVWHLSLD